MEFPSTVIRDATGSLSPFRYDGWTAAQYEFSSRAAYEEALRNGVKEPRITYREALEWHRSHHRVWRTQGGRTDGAKDA